jgi:hypothetical protein
MLDKRAFRPLDQAWAITGLSAPLMSAVLGQAVELTTKSLRHRPFGLETRHPNGQICTPKGPTVDRIPTGVLTFISRFLRKLPKRTASRKT